MLSTFLGQLQTYFSKYFVVGSFCPILVFTFLNGATAYLLSQSWKAWVDSNVVNQGVGRGAFVITSITVGMVLIAYVLSSLNTFLRQLLEGRWWNPLAKGFIPTQNKRRKLLLEQRETARRNTINLKEASNWKRRLKNARASGKKGHADVEFSAPKPDLLENQLKALEALEKKNEVVSADALLPVVDQLSPRLETHDAEKGTYLNHQHVRLIALITYADERSKARYARSLNELHSGFGEEEVAPTKMGNIANTIQGYALRRYCCNLEAIWSNLQRVVQVDDRVHASLQESKTRLDFLVACCWLTLCWSAIWTVVFLVVVPIRLGFLIAAVGGPAIAYTWYRVAAEQYRSFADITMTTLDSFRFKLLEEMQLRIPDDVEDERTLWEGIDNLTTDEEKINFRYVKPGSP